MYVKTEGPVPEGAPITVGKVYKLTERGEGLRPFIISDIGKTNCVCIPQCSIKMCPEWTFCDQHGNPVAAPWESEPMESAEEMAAIYPEPIDYRAHAERLAEKGDQILAIIGLTAFKHESQRAVLQEAYDELRAALAAYNQAKGEA